MRKMLLFFFVLTPCFAAEPTGLYKQAVESLNQLAFQYPRFASVFSIGQNDNGVDIYAVRVSVTPEAMDPTKIGQFIVSTHHGDERDSTTFTLAFIKNLLERYSSPELWSSNLSQMEWTIIPVLNISGYNANRREELGQDPNRDYPHPCSSNPGGRLKSIQRVMETLKSRVFAGALTVHGYQGSLTYPWGYFATNTHTQDHNLYAQIFSKAASHNGYRTGTAADVVYPANGCFEDWVYWKHGAWSMLLELQSGSAGDIKKTVPAIAAYFDLIDSSPSTKNEFTAQCTWYRGPDLRLD